MKKFVSVLFFSLALASCATLQNPLTKSRMDAIDASWGGALALANGYYDSCEKRLIPSRCRTVVSQMQRIAPTIENKILKARQFANNPTISNIDLIEAASDAINDFKVYQMSNGVK